MTVLNSEMISLLDKLYNLRGSDSAILVSMEQERGQALKTCDETSLLKTELQTQINELGNKQNSLQMEGNKLQSVLSAINADDFRPTIDEYRELDRNEYFYLPGRILHLDGDSEYLSRCMKFYKKNKIMAYGLHIIEDDMPSRVQELLKKYTPDILVLTGHDAFSRNKREKYKNTSSFVLAVSEARKYEKSHEKLFIIAGACQSNYEDLIKAGANFASSPKRINIHALDPAIVAACLSFSNKNKDIDIMKILSKTKYGSSGMGGIITKGSMYIGYPR